MKIAFISQYFYPEQFSNNEIARDLVKRGHTVDVFSCVPNYPEGRFFSGYSNSSKRTEEWNGVNIYRCRTVPRGNSAVKLILNFGCYPVAAASELIRRKAVADVSLVSMPSPLTQALAGIFLKRFKKTPTVYWVQDIWPESVVYTLGIKNRFAIKLLNALCGWIYRQADLVLVQSAAFPPMVERFGVPAKKVQVFPNTAPDTYIPLPSGANTNAGKLVPKTGFRLMFAGNIGESQDFDTILEAAKLLEGVGELTWVVVGSGRDLDRVKSEVARLGLDNVFSFLGRHPESEMPEFFAEADAMLVSLKDNAIFRLTVPYKVQCYMACGKPIVAALTGEGGRVISESGAGLVCAASDADRLAAAVSEMVNTSVRDRKIMGDAGRAYFERNYSQSAVYGNLETWLSEVVRDTDRGSG